MILAFLISTLIVFSLNLAIGLVQLNYTIANNIPKQYVISSIAVTLVFLTWNAYCILSW